jgi:ferredoxin
MRTFDQGADGVLVLGCHIGECHYDSGNHRTAKRLPIVRSLMAFSGLEPERIRLDWVSASEGERFSRIVNEFTDTVRSIGPVRWRVESGDPRIDSSTFPRWGIHSNPPETQPISIDFAHTEAIRDVARGLLASGEVSCVIGYESGTHGRTRPVFIDDPMQVDRLVWNQDCTHNLTTYLYDALNPPGSKRTPGRSSKKVAIVVKPCDSRALNVLMSEQRFQRDQVYAIGVACDGIRDGRRGGQQERCLQCSERTPLVSDIVIGQAPAVEPTAVVPPRVAELDALQPDQRMEYWLSQFDRCIRCYACRQACPMCDCPTCLYERDDSLWVGMGITTNEKRTFHLGRAYHLAGRCIDCHECERVCPMEIPISLLNGKLIQEMQAVFAYRAGMQPVPSPFVTILNGEENLS